MFTREDLEDLETMYQAAVTALPEVIYPGGYPEYPRAIKAFMDKMCFPPWINRDYKPAGITELIANVDNATAEDLRAILTSVLRSERFGDGNWVAMLANGDIDKVIARARELLETGLGN